jgi:hypothetical protein
MRLDLQADPSTYVKQVAELRRLLNRADAAAGTRWRMSQRCAFDLF